MISKLKSPIFDYDPVLAELRQATYFQQQLCCLECRPPDYGRYVKWILDNYPIKLKKPHTFFHLAWQMSEDIAIHCNDWLAAAAICFPSGWYPEEKIGKSFAEIHRPVPVMPRTKLSYSSTVEQTLYGLGRGVNRHPRLPVEHNFITRERQVMVGFGDSVLFIIRQYLEPITPEGLAKLPTDPAMRRYKCLNSVGAKRVVKTGTAPALKPEPEGQ